MDTCSCLPFGLRSAPYLFNRESEAIHWTITNNYGVQHLLHYLDDFLIVVPANFTICSQNLNAMLTLCEKINSPVKSSKIEGPFTYLTFLGIQSQWKPALWLSKRSPYFKNYAISTQVVHKRMSFFNVRRFVCNLRSFDECFFYLLLSYTFTVSDNTCT